MLRTFATPIALALLVVGARPAAANVQHAANRIGQASGTVPLAAPFVDVPAQAIPVVADYNGDGRDDVLWYGPGTRFDQLMFGRADRTFTRASIRIDGVYEPLEGDFNGDHRADILWYGPGTLADHLWLGRGDGTFASHSVTVNGGYQPHVGDFNGDGRDDVLWYAPGTAADYVAYGVWSGVFSVHSVTINGSYDFVTGGDFTGDGRTDVLFWSAHATHHPVWFARPSSGFTSGTFASPAAGAYPMVMKVDNDAKSDILWYGPGNIADALVESTLGYGHFVAESVHGDYQPLWGNFDGDAHSYTDVLWWARGPGQSDFSAAWKGTGGGFHDTSFVIPPDWTTHYPTFGDFNGDGKLDICYYDASGRNTLFNFN